MSNVIDQKQSNDSATISNSIQLSNLEKSSVFEQTLNKNPKKKFDLNQFIKNAVYPAECPMDDDLNLTGTLLNASFQINHLSTPMQSSSGDERVNLDDTMVSQDLNETIVDEEMVWNLSQKISLNDSLTPNDYELLDIMRQLEEQEECDESGIIEEDSMLAPLTQSSIQQKLSQRQSQELAYNKNVIAVDQDEDNLFEDSVLENIQGKPKSSNFADDYFNDSDDDLLNEFSRELDTEDLL